MSPVCISRASPWALVLNIALVMNRESAPWAGKLNYCIEEGFSVPYQSFGHSQGQTHKKLSKLNIAS